MSDEIDELRDAVRALEERITAMEASPPATPTAALNEEAFWALTGLQARLPAHPETEQGAVMLVGSLTLPTGAPISWQQSAGTAGLIETEWADRAASFAALGHPVRIELVRHILAGTQSTAELAALEGLGTTGQLHHHLRQLVAAGWVRQSGRGTYEVPSVRVVPLLATIVGAER